MQPKIVVPLERSILGHRDKPIVEGIVREPTYAEYCQFGEPYTVATSRDGIPFLSENLEALQGYMRCCLEGEGAELIRARGTFRDAQRVKNAIMSFFLPAGGGETGGSGEDSTTSPGSSPSPAGAAATSGPLLD